MITPGYFGRTVYQFTTREGVADYYPVRVLELACSCGSAVRARPQDFAIDDAVGTQEGWALVCQCGMAYWPGVPDHKLTSETLTYLGAVEADSAGHCNLRGFRYLLLAATLPERAGAEPALPERWRDAEFGLARLCFSEEEEVIAQYEGRLLVVWLAPGKEAYDALRDTMRG